MNSNTYLVDYIHKTCTYMKHHVRVTNVSHQGSCQIEDFGGRGSLYIFVLVNQTTTLIKCIIRRELTLHGLLREGSVVTLI